MRVPVLLLSLSPALCFHVVPPKPASLARFATPVIAEPETQKKILEKQPVSTVSLLTFDLDDTLYPLQPVLDEANAAFARAMQQLGFPDIQPADITETSRRIRQEMAEQDPEKAAVLTHTEIRVLAIRREMETVIVERKLRATAEEWATAVSSLSTIVVSYAKKWAATAVSPAMVQAVMNAWEMERHHAAERHLYPEVMDVLETIRQDHPNVVIGAVTDGKANPALMTFTLGKYFDFCVSWEDDQGARRKFFTELNSVSKQAQLQWIYKAALEKYGDISAAKAEMLPDTTIPEEFVWIHVGDDLAYDVGGAKSCGALTIWTELAEKYGQTARHRFGTDGQQPSWSVTPSVELEARRVLNEAARADVDKSVSFLTRLPEAINDLLELQ